MFLSEKCEAYTAWRWLAVPPGTPQRAHTAPAKACRTRIARAPCNGNGHFDGQCHR